MANFSNTTKPDHQTLAKQLNDEMTMAVLPVTVFVGIEMFLGFFGNIFVLYVFLFRYHVCNFRYFVLCLAFVDIISSVTTMPGEIITQLNWYIYPVPTVCKIKSFFNVFTVSAQALCLLTISIDRYLKVCRPFGWQIKPKSALIICGIIYCCSFILAFPVAIFWGTHSHETVYKNVTITVTVCEKDEEYEQTNHPLKYTLSIEGIVSTCLIIMFGLYIFVAKRLFQNKRERRGSIRLAMPAKPTGPKPFQCPISTVFNDSSTASECNDANSEHRVTRPEVVNVSQAMTEEVYCSVVSSKELDNASDTMSTDTIVLGKPKAGEQRIKINSKMKSMQLRKALLQKEMSSRIHRKTLIMFILTVVFIVTTILYMTLLSFIAKSDDILEDMSDSDKTIYFLFFRLYFINHVINPIIYGFLDPKFRAVMASICGK